MIAGTYKDMRLAAKQLHVFSDDDGLSPAFNQGTEVKMITRHDHQIEAIGLVHDPVILWKRIVQIGDDKASHRESIGSGV
jgi:hypothetical protein